MMKNPFDPKHLREMFELAEQHRRAIEPYKGILEKMAYQTSHLENAYQNIATFRNLIPKDFNSMLILNNLSSEVFERVQEVKEQLDKVGSSLTMVDKFLSQTKVLGANFFEKQQEIAQLQEALSSSSLYFQDFSSLPFDRINDSIARFVAIYQTYDISDQIIQFALQPSVAYQHFVSKQLSHMEIEPPRIINRRTKLVDLAGDLFNLTDSVTELGLLTQIEIDENSLEDTCGEEREEFYPQKTPNLYKILNQHVGYAFRPKTSVDIEQAFSNAKPAKICSCGTAIIHLIYEINDVALRKNSPEIFKPTNKLFSACLSIPNRIARNERDFAEVIDHLYFLLYEGTGEAKRLTNLVDDKDLAILWSLKHLRLSFRHDIEHGSEKEITKKYQNISDAYRKLLGVPKARYSKDWTLAQLNLYVQLIEMLKTIYEAQNAEQG